MRKILSLFKFRVSLRVGIIIFSLLCILLGLVLINYRAGYIQKRTVSNLQRPGNVRIDYDYHLVAGGEARAPLPLHPSWLGRTFGKDYFHRVEGIELTQPSNAQIELLFDLPNLKNVHLKGDIQQIHLDQILKLSNLISLSITQPESRLNQVCPFHFDQLAQLNNLTEFTFKNGILVDRHWVAISQAKGLQTLKLLETKFQFDDPEVLDATTSVRQLYWTAVASGKRGLEVDFLGLLPSLETFVFQAIQSLSLAEVFHQSPQNAMNLSTIDDSALLQLKEAKNLRELSLFRTEITGQGLEHLSTNSLVTLELPVSHLDDNGLAHLERFESLEYLEIGSTDITDLGMDSLANLTNLQTLSIRDTAIGDPGLAAIQRLPSLQLLRIRDTKISEAAIRAYQQANPNGVIDRQ